METLYICVSSAEGDIGQNSLRIIGDHIYGFKFNLELICTGEFFKKLKLHKPLQINSKLNLKPYDYLSK